MRQYDALSEASTSIGGPTPLGGRQDSLLEFLVDPNFIIDRDEILLGPKLGEGFFGIVFKGRWNGQDVALKQLKDGVHQGELENFRKEVSVVCTLRHPNIVSFFGVTPRPKPMIVSQLLHCSLWDMLHATPPQRVSNRTKMYILRDISCGLAYLHTRSPRILHRDLSSLNVLLTGDAAWLEARSLENQPVAKLNDFGLSRPQDKYMTAGAGNCYYLAPEVYTGERYDTKADVYSLGVLTWEIFTQVKPQGLQEPLAAAYSSSILGSRPDIPTSVSVPLRTLIESCWQHLPSNRPASVKVLQCINRWLGVNTTTRLQDVPEDSDPISRLYTVVPSIIARQQLIDPVLYGMDRRLAELPSEIPAELLAEDREPDMAGGVPPARTIQTATTAAPSYYFGARPMSVVASMLSQSETVTEPGTVPDESTPAPSQVPMSQEVLEDIEESGPSQLPMYMSEEVER